MKLALFTLVVGAMLAAPCHVVDAQELPPAATPQASPPKPHHARHRRHHTMRLHSPATRLATPAPVQADAGGSTPAPVPNEDIGPPRAPNDTKPSVDPGNLSIHYPPLGEGYLPGSSPQDMANTQTPKVPGVTVKLPMEQPRPETLPPPADH